jgi:hypothetical protein
MSVSGLKLLMHEALRIYATSVCGLRATNVRGLNGALSYK